MTVNSTFEENETDETDDKGATYHNKNYFQIH